MERLKASADCWLSLAAAPTFAIMAFVTAAFSGGAPDMFCTAAQHGSLLNGMVSMYLLMSAFHSAPWLKLISGRRGACRSRSGVRTASVPPLQSAVRQRPDTRYLDSSISPTRREK